MKQNPLALAMGNVKSDTVTQFEPNEVFNAEGFWAGMNACIDRNDFHALRLVNGNYVLVFDNAQPMISVMKETCGLPYSMADSDELVIMCDSSYQLLRMVGCCRSLNNYKDITGNVVSTDSVMITCVVFSQIGEVTESDIAWPQNVAQSVVTQ